MNPEAGSTVIQKNRTSLWIGMLILSILWSISASILPAYADSDVDNDVKLGKDAAAQVAKECKFIDDKALLQRVDTIGQAVAVVAKKKQVSAAYGTSKLMNFDYSFKIVKDDAVNAFSLPGGYVYVNKGLLDSVQSDDELAAVLAHEIAHVAHRHSNQLMKTQSKQTLGMLAAVAAGAALGARGDNLINVAYVANIVSIAKLSGYGQEAENDADRTAVNYLVETKYNPVGMLTFMERLARDDLRKPQVTYGIYADHPGSSQRAAAIIEELKKHNVVVNRRLVTNYTRVKVKEESGVSSIWISDTEIMKVADADGKKSNDRAQAMAGILSGVLLGGANMQDIRLDDDKQTVMICNKPVFSPKPEDAKLANMTVTELTKSISYGIRRALMNERFEQNG